MAYKYSHFIPQNIAPKDIKEIGIYNSKGKQIYTIPLGSLTPPTKEKLYSFGLLSDIHLYNTTPGSLNSRDTKFKNALQYFKNQGCSFMCHCGDLVDYSFSFTDSTGEIVKNNSWEKYNELRKTVDFPIYGCCGNHESYCVNSDNKTFVKTIPDATSITIGTETKAMLEFLYDFTTEDGTTGTASLHYAIEQGNDLFVFCGQPREGAVMSDEALQWLGETLETNRNKRCFVFVHAYIEEDSGDAMDVRENSIFEMWGTANKQAFMNLLAQYPNTVLFHGHSHMKLHCQELDECANYTRKNGFHSVHVPSCAVPRDVDTVNKVSVNDNNASEGYIVDVYDDCIVLNGIDLISNKPIPLGTFKIDVKGATV